MPVRKIPKNARSVTGQMPSLKLNRLVAYESTLERDLLTLLEFDPNVKWYEEQPVTIPYRLATGRQSRYTPDALVEFSAHPVSERPFQPVLIEVKPRKELAVDVAALRLRMRAGRRYAVAKGWKFRVFTEREIRVVPLLPNARFLLGFRAGPPADETNMEALRNVLPADSHRPIMDLAREMASAMGTSPSMCIPILWSLVAQHELQMDLMRPLAGTSDVWWPDA